MAGFDFFGASELPTPLVSDRQAATLAADLFGVTGTATGLGSQQDANFLVTAAGNRFVLKVANPVFGATELLAQNRAAAHVAAADPYLRVPQAVAGTDGSSVRPVDLDGRQLLVRLLSFVDGAPWSRADHLSPAAVAELGSVAGRLVRALSDFSDPGAERVLQWDLRVADRVVALLAHHVGNPALQARVRDATADSWRTIGPIRDRLPTQVIHGDVTDDNIVGDRPGTGSGTGSGTGPGIIDFGDLTHSWAIGELAVACTSVLAHLPGQPAAVLPAIRAFHALRPLSVEEVTALWPLVVLRAAVLVVSGRQQISLDRSNAYAERGLAKDWTIFDQATSVPIPVMTSLIRYTLSGLGPAPFTPPPWASLVPAIPGHQVTTVDFSVTAPELDDGRFLEPGIELSVARSRLGRDGDAVVTVFGAPRLTRTALNSMTAPATTALGVEVFLAHEADVAAPWAGVVDIGDDGAALQAGGVTIWLTGLAAAGSAGTREVRAGEHIGRTGPDTGPLTITLTRDLTGRPPFVVDPEMSAGWRSHCLDPSFLLGLDLAPGAGPADTAAALISRRNAVFATVQEHYYSAPPQIERGWRQHLFDADGRSYLDMVNNVAILGHGHPRVAQAAARQWRLLNTNSRFHYRAVVEFSERLAALLPDPLDTVFLVNSGTEAVDLALRLAWAGTGRRDVVTVQEAYHGWSDATDAISTSTADNPNAALSRPDWVHPLAAPNAYRGRYRGPQAFRYADDAATAIRDLGQRGRPPAAFVAEAFYGNAGGMALPAGYLPQVYAAVRAEGGYCIADEVQVGYGRLGHFFWGFQEQAVVPDIVTVAKAIGNGHPLGAVITTREIAEGYRSQGYFFSSAGGSPVSSRIGTTVLDVLQQEGLQANARAVGDHLRTRLRMLADRHELIGAVHGCGLYLGVELVRSRETLEPAVEETAAICERLLQLGVIMAPTSDRMCVLKVKPPLGLSVADADFFVETLDRVLGELG